MKRDQSISLTYLPPRVRVVDSYAESNVLVAVSQMRINSMLSVDELNSMGVEDSDEQYWFE